MAVLTAGRIGDLGGVAVWVGVVLLGAIATEWIAVPPNTRPEAVRQGFSNGFRSAMF
jgi:hypothetical protein